MRPLALAIVAALLLSGCAREDEGAGDVPTLVVTGTIVETHAGNGDQHSPVCSHDPPYRGDPRDGSVELNALAQRALQTASAAALLAIDVRTDDDSLCGAGIAMILLPSAERNATIAAPSAGVDAIAHLSVQGTTLILDADRLDEGASLSLQRNGTRRSGFEGDFAYVAEIRAEHAGCWRVEDARFVERRCA